MVYGADVPITGDITIREIDHDYIVLWKRLVQETGAKSYREALMIFLDAYEDSRLVIMPKLTWDSFLEAMVQASCRQARKVARKETDTVLFERGFIPTPHG